MLLKAVRYAVVLCFTGTVAYFSGTYFGKFIEPRKYAEVRANTTDIVVNKMGTIAVGDTLKDITFEDMEKNNLRLSEIVENRSVIMFMRVGCSLCLEEIEEIQNVEEDHPSTRKFILVSPDDRLNILHAIKTYSINLRILWDEERRYGSFLNITTYPFNIIVDENLVIKEIIAGKLMRTEIEQLALGVEPEKETNERR